MIYLEHTESLKNKEIEQLKLEKEIEMIKNNIPIENEYQNKSE